ncbi:TniQ family protein [Rhizobium sp. 9T]|uniref:TniQ family protein n=1 Tax=Rhizobium croatiense TaxID=2867516 RepID=UPI001C9324A8|nr:TniQ family protein [Rhizobium croatiense]MBY4607471.1 TniQ family protein [Rhizobium croatiense]
MSTRAFARWDFGPEADEPSHGYFLRLVRAQGLDTTVTFNIWNGIENDRVDPARSLAIIEDHPLPEQWKVMLRGCSPMVDGSRTEIRGETVWSAQVSYYPRRWCPACIAERPYHRFWWDLVPLHSCPFHGTTLAREDREGAKVSWTWPDFHESRRGVPLGVAASRIEGGDSFGDYVLGRLGARPPISVPMLDGAMLGDAIEFCEVIGKFLSNPRLIAVPDIRPGDAEAGYRVICKGKVAIAEALRRWIGAHNPDHKTRTSLAGVFGWIANKTWAVRNDELNAILRRALHEARAFHRTPSLAIAAANFDVEYIATKVMASNLNMEVKGVKLIAREIGVYHAARLKRNLSREDADAIQAFARSLQTPGETERQLGLPSDALRHLVHAGYLKVFRGLDRGQRNGARFDQGRVDKILRALDALPVEGSPEYGITFGVHRTREKLVVGELAVDILAGKVPIAEKRSDIHGFKGLMIQTKRPRKRADFGRSPDFVSMREAQAILNLSNVTVAALLKQGTLGEVQRMPRFVLLKRAEVVNFGLKHAKIADFSRTIGLHPMVIHKHLMAAGVRLAVYPNNDEKGPRLESVVAKEDVMRVFEIDEDPTVLHDAQLNDFWTRLVGHAREHCPYVYFPDRLPAEGQRVWQSAGIFSAVFRFDLDEYMLDVMLVPAGGDRQSLKLAITGDDHGIVDLMLLMTRTIDAALAAAAEKKRAGYVAKGPAARDERGRIKGL